MSSEAPDPLRVLIAARSPSGAKGILMERHGIDEREAFELLRSHSRRTGRKLIDLAEAVTTSHLVLRVEEAPRVSPEG